MQKAELEKAIFNLQSHNDFNELALEVFKFQFNNNRIYRSFCDLINRAPSDVKNVKEIPFLPIQFFKSHEVLSNKLPVETTFTSSGTTGNQTSTHFITDLKVYEQSFQKAFDLFYGDINDYTILALLPSYLERNGSSLIYMVNRLIEKSSQPDSGFYLENLSELANKIKFLDNQGKKTLLIGVSFALMNLVEKHKFNLTNAIVMETGGMKGRRKELIRKELHALLKKGFGVKNIHSEYGMTELLSQAYSKGEGLFECPPWMKILIRDTEDPLKILQNGMTGGLNVIDLANINSCSFIATQDLGSLKDNNNFEVLGRFDHSDIRGCNLMVL